MEDYIKNVGQVIFGILSENEIGAMSVCKIDRIYSKKKPEATYTQKTLDERNLLKEMDDFTLQDDISFGTEYDKRMGPLNKKEICITCNQDYFECPGHFGHIDLNTPIIHPLYVREVSIYLKCVCHNCYRLLVSKEQAELWNILKLSGECRYKYIVEKCSKISMCYKCDTPCPNIKYDRKKRTISVFFKENGKNIATTVLKVPFIRIILNNIPDEDISLFGFDPKLSHPKNMILSKMLIPPICSRSPIYIDGKMGDDDLTIQIAEIVKTNNTIGLFDGNMEGRITNGKKTLDLENEEKNLEFKIKSFMDNSNGMAKNPTNSRPIKSVGERFKGKTGLFRGNMFGKRTEQSARTVIGPDPSLRIDEIAVPLQICKNLTIPEIVTEFNKEYLETLLFNDGIDNIERYDPKVKKVKKFITEYLLYSSQTKILFKDIIIRKTDKITVYNPRDFILIEGDIIERNGKKIKTELRKRKNLNFRLNIGDKISRRLHINDYLVFNRQPTLWIGSMMGLKIIPSNRKTFGINLAIAKSFNADFDGDESNGYIPQSKESISEIKYLSNAKNLMISPQTSGNNLPLVQDPILGAYLITRNNDKIEKHTFFDLCMFCEFPNEIPWTPGYIISGLKRIRMVLKKMGKKAISFNGRGLFSLMLPEGFNYTQKLTTGDKLIIHDGVILEGYFDKKVMGSSRNTIPQILNREYSPDVAANFINNVQFVSNEWLSYHQYSIGLEDCFSTRSDDIQETIISTLFKAEAIKEQKYPQGIEELKIMAILGNARDTGMKLAKESLSKDNNFVTAIHSGAKGDFFNISQITGLLGQQSLNGRRIKPTLMNGKKTLPHYTTSRSLTIDESYESKGFVANSFIKGLTPRQYFSHARVGRDGVVGTAIKTADTGYLQNKIGKLCEDLQSKYDGTVRNTYGTIFQMFYASDGFDRAKMVEVKGKLECMDIYRMVDRLNLNYEKTHKK